MAFPFLRFYICLCFEIPRVLWVVGRRRGRRIWSWMWMQLTVRYYRGWVPWSPGPYLTGRDT